MRSTWVGCWVTHCRIARASSTTRIRGCGCGRRGLATYPDVSVICGKLELDPEDPKRHTAVNPKVLVEILSPSSEDYDRGDKLGHYKQIPSLEEVLLVAHDRREIEIVRREADGSWSREIAREGEVVRVVSLGVELSVGEIYRDPLATAAP